jgi:hypothetical protein
MSNGTPGTFPFNMLLNNSPPNNCYETVAQPVCHRQIVMCVVYVDHIEFWCATHAPAGVVANPQPEPEPAIAPITFPEP